MYKALLFVTYFSKCRNPIARYIIMWHKYISIEILLINFINLLFNNVLLLFPKLSATAHIIHRAYITRFAYGNLYSGKTKNRIVNIAVSTNRTILAVKFAKIFPLSLYIYNNPPAIKYGIQLIINELPPAIADLTIAKYSLMAMHSNIEIAIDNQARFGLPIKNVKYGNTI